VVLRCYLKYVLMGPHGCLNMKIAPYASEFHE
jgi:hypothetical protein